MANASPVVSLALRDRVGLALRALRGEIAPPDATRAIIPLTFPNAPTTAQPGNGLGTAQLSLVRTANPQEYKPDGATIRAEGFNKHPVVHACMRLIADIVASIPWVVLSARGDYEARVPDSHPLQLLLDNPGPRMSARTMRARVAVDFLGYGNAMLEIDRGPGGTGLPRALGAINPESLQSVWVDQNGDPRRYDYGNWSGIIVQRAAEDIVHVKDLDMPRPFMPNAFGFPRGATAIGSIAADNEATKYVRQVVSNDGTPTFAVLLSDEATQDDATAMQQRYAARVVDRGKRGTPAFFGAVRDIKPLGFTLSDLEFPDLRRVSREDICAAFGVDPRMIGIASASKDGGLSGAQYVEARARLVQHTIEPMLACIEDEFNFWLAPEFGNVWISYDHDVMRDLVENDEVTSTRVRGEYGDGLRTWEESRRALRLSPLPEPTDTLLLKAGATMTPAAVAVIDPRAVADEAPATDGEPVPGAPAAGGAAPMTGDVQATAMNGAQTQALVEMLKQVADNALPSSTVNALIKAAFPGVPDELVSQMLAGLASFTPAAPAPAAAPAPRRAARVLVRAMADKALAGDQIEQLVELLEMVVEGELPAGAVQALIVAAFPAIPSAAVSAMLKALEGFAPPEEEPEADDGEDDDKEALGDRAARRSGANSLPVPSGVAMAPMATGNAATLPAMAASSLTVSVPVTPLVDEQGRPWWVHHPEVLDRPRFRDDDEPDEDHILYRFYTRRMSDLDRQEQPFYRTAKARFADDARAVARLFSGAQARAHVRARDPILDEIERRIRENYAPGGDYHAAWREAYLKLIEEMYLFGARDAVGVGYSFGMKSPEVLRAIANRAELLATYVGETTSQQVLAAVRAGELAEMSYREVARLIQQTVYGEPMTDTRAMRIARTETNGALSQGEWDQVQAEGDLFRSKEWLAFTDRKTRETHLQAMSEGVIPMDARFGNGLLYVMEQGADAAEVINCRCTMGYYTQAAPGAEGTP